jgi:hypothetical protein
MLNVNATREAFEKVRMRQTEARKNKPERKDPMFSPMSVVIMPSGTSFPMLFGGEIDRMVLSLDSLIKTEKPLVCFVEISSGSSKFVLEKEVKDKLSELAKNMKFSIGDMLKVFFNQESSFTVGTLNILFKEVQGNASKNY